MTISRPLTLLLFVVGAACSGQDPVAVPDPGDGFAIRQHDDTLFEATVTAGGASLRLQVQRVEGDVVDAANFVEYL